MTMVERMPPRFFVGAEPSRPDATPEPWFLDPREIRRVLRARWKLVLAPAPLFLLAALAWLVLIPPQYAAVTQILMDPRGIQVVKDGVTPPDQASDASLLLVDSQIRVLISDEVLRRVVEQFKLDQDPEFVRPASFLDTVKGSLSSLLGASGGTAADDTLTALRALRDRTGARRLERSFVVELSVTSESRQKAADLTQAIAQTYLDTVSEMQAQVTRKAGEALSGRLGELQDSLRQAEDKAQQFRAANNLVGTRGQLVSEQTLTQLNQQLGAARARVAELRGRLAQIEAVGNGRADLNSVTEIVQSSTIAQLRAQLAQVEAARADTVANLGPRHPTLRTSELQVQSLRSQIEAEIRRIAAATRNDYKSAQANEASLAATLESRKNEALSVDKSFVRLRELERQVEARRAVYESFLVRARELQEQQRLDTSSARIISPASLPARRLGPPAVLVFVAALAAGLGIGVALALLAVPAAGRIGSRRRLQQIAGLPVIATLPKKAGNPDGTKALRADTAYDVAVARLGSRLQRDFGATRPTVILVTSADDRNGKSELARNLAVSAALDGQRVLLVDADPAAILSGDLRLRARRGIAEVLRTQTGFSGTLMDGPSGVKVLPFDEEAMRLGTHAYAGAILSAAAAFDAVFVDIGLIGTDVAAERFAQDERFPALLLTASAARSSVARLRRALDAIGREPRAHLVMTDADSEA
ncbi:MAG TPA: exopolysaccharide transport family protein [Methylorubrum populi]|uniref:Exopolysaccharide transport family protein n=1 Tax=Methylorubrum populi TaxID=223967 RepID=A0A921E2L2_9HYPH|nr:exopolysaccharide transport family protein [Methylorubrum populi]